MPEGDTIHYAASLIRPVLEGHVPDAIETPHPRFGADDSAAERFRLEARTAAALEHPNICTVHEIGETEDGQLFLAMPLYDGLYGWARFAAGETHGWPPKPGA